MPEGQQGGADARLDWRRLVACVVLGFSSGLPLFLLINLLPAWLKAGGVSLAAIGGFALVQLPYAWKFLWSPLVDRYAFAGLGRRRSWMLASQVLLVASIAALGTLDPASQVREVAFAALAVALLSATQDIAIDAYRREILREGELGLGNAVFVNAYKVAGLVPGSLSLLLADHLPWSQVFAVTAAFLVPGMVLSLVASEPEAAAAAPRTLRAAVVEPFADFVGRQGWRSAATVLAFVFLYKLGDSLATALATPFYLDMGFANTDIAIVAKNAGLWCSVAGGLVGGAWMLRLGINRALWVFGVVQALAILGFAWLASQGSAPTTPERLLHLGAVIGVEAFGVGLGTTAFVSFLARATSPAYAATQYALLSSLMAVPRTVVNAFAGVLVERLGWPQFFLLCFLLAFPGMALLARVAPWRESR